MKRLLALALLLPAIARAEPQQMVAAAHPLAVEAGLDVLRRGGTAVDAAVAVRMMLGVVEPQASGIGGGGFLLYYDAQSRGITVYDGRETAPAGATPAMFLRDGRPLPYPEAQASGLSVGVPGAIALLELAHKEHGKLPWADLFATSIKAAREGVPVSPRLARAGEHPAGNLRCRHSSAKKRLSCLKFIRLEWLRESSRYIPVHYPGCCVCKLMKLANLCRQRASTSQPTLVSTIFP